MTIFPTPEPVALHIRNGSGRIEVEPVADLDETEIELTALNDAGARAIEQAIVEQRGDAIVVVIPDKHGLFGRGPSVAVAVRVRADSTLDVTAGSADVTVGDGLRTVAVTSGSARVRVGQVTGDARVRSGSGDVTIADVGGSLTVRTGSGDIAIGCVAADATTSSGSGDVRVAEVVGSIVSKSGSGNLVVARLDGRLESKSGSGNVHVERAATGTVSVRTASGDVRIGVAEGTATWLDVNTVSGRIDQQLPDRGAPTDDSPRLAITATTVSGAIDIRRG